MLLSHQFLSHHRNKFEFAIDFLQIITYINVKTTTLVCILVSTCSIERNCDEHRNSRSILPSTCSLSSHFWQLNMYWHPSAIIKHRSINIPAPIEILSTLLFDILFPTVSVSFVSDKYLRQHTMIPWLNFKCFCVILSEFRYRRRFLLQPVSFTAAIFAVNNQIEVDIRISRPSIANDYRYGIDDFWKQQSNSKWVEEYYWYIWNKWDIVINYLPIKRLG
jgi:hypothetical protein